MLTTGDQETADTDKELPSNHRASARPTSPKTLFAPKTPRFRAEWNSELRVWIFGDGIDAFKPHAGARVQEMSIVRVNPLKSLSLSRDQMDSIQRPQEDRCI